MNNNISDISVDASTFSTDSSKRHDNIHVYNHSSGKVLIPITQDMLSQDDDHIQDPTEDLVPDVIDNHLPDSSHVILHSPKKAVFQTPTQIVEITTDNSIPHTNIDIDASNSESVAGSSVSDSVSEEQKLY